MSLACLDLNFSVDERSAAEDFLFRLSCRGEEKSLLLLFSLLGACHLSTVCDARMDNSWVAVLILFFDYFCAAETTDGEPSCSSGELRVPKRRIRYE